VTVKSDIEIAHEAKLQPVQTIAAGLRFDLEDLELYGRPGLPKKPAAESIDIDDNGNVVGLF
jgi:formyltetrahydrofolate synthetase